MTELEILTSLLDKKEYLVAIVAPSFPVMYTSAELATKLRTLGFAHIIEVSAGAKRTNKSVVKLLQENPTSRFIASPCASFVRFVRTKYPQYVKYLTFQADSPMIATAKIAKETYPDSKVVFIGPCLVKKREASEDYPELDILVLTYKELNMLLEQKKLLDIPTNPKEQFDVVESSTRIFPYDGGLTESSGLRTILRDEEIRIVSGYKNCETTLKEFGENTNIRFVDILFCEGGCINGPGVVSPLSIPERKKIVQEYADLASKSP